MSSPLLRRGGSGAAGAHRDGDGFLRMRSGVPHGADGERPIVAVPVAVELKGGEVISGELTDV